MGTTEIDLVVGLLAAELKRKQVVADGIAKLVAISEDERQVQASMLIFHEVDLTQLQKIYAEAVMTQALLRSKSGATT
jgi:hypothetical protein